MATVTLHRSELHHLPPVCVRCGAAARHEKDETFTWTPTWAQFLVFVGLLPWVLAVMLTRQKATAKLPLCDAHLRKRPVIHLVVLVGFMLSGALILLGFSTQPENEAALVTGFAALGLTLLVVMFGSDGSARATHITRTTVTLDRLNPAFVEAVRNGVTPFGGGATTFGGVVELQTAKYLRR